MTPQHRSTCVSSMVYFLVRSRGDPTDRWIFTSGHSSCLYSSVRPMHNFFVQGKLVVVWNI